MSHHRLPSHTFACLRALACAAALSCAVLMLAPLGAGAQDTAQEDAPENAQVDAQTDTQADTQADTEAETPADTPAEAEAEESPAVWDLARPCENFQHPYEADLCQQWRAAEAAEKAAAAAQRTVGMTRVLMLIGVIVSGLLLLMFVPLVMAALAARRAARGGVAAQPVSAAREDGDRADELRAYVDVDKLEFIETPESEGIVKVKIVFRNTGQTPAFRMRSAANVGIRDVADEDLVPVMPLSDNRSAGAARPRLGRDTTLVEIVDCDSTPSLADRVMNGDATIVVWGWTEYYDVFDRKQRTVFQYLCNAETLDTGQIFKPMTRGDENS